MINQSIRTFLCANSSKGFFSYFDGLREFENTYIIKGGPGTGKSGFMRRAAAAASAEDFFVEHVYCSSDPDSLDGVGIPEIPIAVADGTPPHVIEPKYPGAHGGIINLGAFWNEKKLVEYQSDIVYLCGYMSDEFARAYRYLAAAGEINADISKISGKFLNREKLAKFIKSFVRRNIPDKTGAKGKIRKRFLSGITPKGWVTFSDTLYSLSDRVFVIKDKYFLSGTVIGELINEACAAGYEVYAFYSPLMPETPSHMAVPELGFSVATSDPLTAIEPQNAGNYSITRFISDDIHHSKKNLSTSMKIMRLCVDEAVKSLKNAKSTHDDLEEIYISAMDFRSVDEYTSQFIKKYIKK